MTTREPGEVRDPRAGTPDAPVARSGRRLEEPPSARYAVRAAEPDDMARASLIGPLAQALVAAAVGAVLLFLVGAVEASTVGLVFVSGVMGAAVGLLLANAAVGRDGTPPAMHRATVVRVAVGIAIGAVAVADVATWLYALEEGGALGLFDYLFETFGPFVPGELLVAALGAAWGASSGPVSRS